MSHGQSGEVCSGQREEHVQRLREAAGVLEEEQRPVWLAHSGGHRSCKEGPAGH